MFNSAWAADPLIMDVWPGTPPGENKDLPPESDTSGPDGRKVAGRAVIRLGNVSTPQIAVYRPDHDIDTGAAVVICPGGGHHILAYDLEGTEVAEWLNSIGVTGIVLKYRVPSRDPDDRPRAAVQDAQRAMRLVRAHADDWGIDPDRIGICGFSAGGQTAGLTTYSTKHEYAPVDDVDKHSFRPNFAILVYAAWLVDPQTGQLFEDIKLTQDSAPAFLVHAFDDRITALNPLQLAVGLKRVGVPCELHLYPTGGHGYGLRTTNEAVTNWPERAGQWLKEQGFLSRSK